MDMKGQLGRASSARIRPAIILALTVTYLLLELPFAAHLLDIVGTTADPAVLHKTEIAGRLISGLAASLLVWGLYVIPRSRSFLHGVALCLLTGVPITTAVYVGQSRLVEVLVDRSTAEERQTAFGVLAFTTLIQKGRADVSGLLLDEEGLASAEGKTFVAVLPALGAAMPDVRERLRPQVRAVVRTAVLERMGSASEYYNRVYRPSLEALAKQYEQYRKGVVAHVSALEEVDRRAEAGYAEYVTELRGKGIDGPPSRWQCPRIRKNVRSRGVPVPDSWDCWERRTFVLAARNKGHMDARARYVSQSERTAGFVLPDDLPDFEAFLADANVQGRWRKEIGLTRALPLRLMDLQELERSVYQVILHDNVEEGVRKLEAGVKDFEQGGRYYQDGERAIRSLIIPPLALFFSLFGAVTHFIKSFITIGMLLFPGIGVLAKAMAVVFGLTAASTTFLVPNRITASPAFGRIISVAQDGIGAVPLTTIRWIVHTQPLVYPFNNRVRSVMAPLTGPAALIVIPAIEVLDPPKEYPLAPAEPSEGRAARDLVVAPQWSGLRANGCPRKLRIDAHRGHRDHPENSVPAIIASFNEGLDAVEVDIQRLKDGEWALHHDATLGRTVTGSAAVHQLTTEMWRSQQLLARNGSPTGLSPPTLHEVLSASKPYLARGQTLNIEIKGRYECAAVRSIVRQIESAGVAHSSVNLTSVSAKSLACLNGAFTGYRGLVIPDARAAADVLGQASTRYVAEKHARSLDATNLERIAKEFSAPRGIHLSSQYVVQDPGLIARARKAGLATFVYNLNGRTDRESLEAIRKAVRYGEAAPDGVIIDGPMQPFCRALVSEVH